MPAWEFRKDLAGRGKERWDRGANLMNGQRTRARPLWADLLEGNGHSLRTVGVSTREKAKGVYQGPEAKKNEVSE